MFHNKPKMWGVSSIGERGQIVIPAKLREELAIEKGDNFVFVTKDKFIGLLREDDMTAMLRDWLGQIEDMKNNNDHDETFCD